MKSTAKKLGEKLAVAKDRLMLQGSHGTQKPGELPWAGLLPAWSRVAGSIGTVEGAEWRGREGPSL